MDLGATGPGSGCLRQFQQPVPDPGSIGFGIDQILGGSDRDVFQKPRGESGHLGDGDGGCCYQLERPAVFPQSVRGVSVAYQDSGACGVNFNSSPHGLLRGPSRHRPLNTLNMPWMDTGRRFTANLATFPVARRIGHPYQNRTPPRRKKPRTSFSRVQISELEKRFYCQKYLASAERAALAKALQMTDAQVKTWFQNRRTKWRRQTAEEREAECQHANRLLVLHHDTAPAETLCLHSASTLFTLQKLTQWT